MSPPLGEVLRERLTAALDPTWLEVRDDSAAHAGHVGAREGGHFAVRIESPQFAGLGLLARHRLVYTAVADLLRGGVHALQIEARSTDDIG
jgi:BolA protein